MIVNSKPFSIVLFGYSGFMRGRSAWDVGKPLMDRMWNEIKAKEIKNTGANVWLYGNSGDLFVGVELLQDVEISGTTLEKKKMTFAKYGREKHIGSYTDLGKTYERLIHEIEVNKGIQTGFKIEIYGHDKGPNSVPELDILVEID